MGDDRIQLSRDDLLARLGGAWSDEEIAAAAEALAANGGQLPRGRNSGLAEGIGRAIQRERAMAALAAVVAERGYREVAVGDVLKRAGLSRTTFYQDFKGKEDCFLQTFDAAVDRLARRLRAADPEIGDWRDRLRAQLQALLEELSADPDIARLLLIEARSAAQPALERRDAVVARLVAWLEKLIGEGAGDAPPSTALGVIGGIESQLRTNLFNPQGAADLEALLPSLMYFAVLPYAGHEAAAAEMPVPTAETASESGDHDDAVADPRAETALSA